MNCSWNEHLVIDVPSGAASDGVLTVELWLQPRGQADEPTTEHSPGVFLGRTEVRMHQLLANYGTVPSQEGWFKLSGDAGSVHVLLRFIAADSMVAKRDSISQSSMAEGDDSKDDGTKEYHPVNAMMLRLKFDRLLSKRAWCGWVSHHSRRQQLQGFVIHFQRFSRAAVARLQKAFEQWQSNISALSESRATAPLQTQDVEEAGDVRQRSSSGSARRRRSSGYGHGYGRLGAQQKLQSARMSLEREERNEEERTRRW